MKALEKIQKTREYLDYIERHILNVEKAWKKIQNKCKNMRFVYDDYVYWNVNGLVDYHDLSKLDNEEFCQYRAHFYPTELEKFTSKSTAKEEFNKAWAHHYENNPHHWENWARKKYYDPYEAEMHCVCMVVDWLAMSYEFGDSPRSYYEKNKERIDLPDWAVKFVYEIFDNLEK